MGLDVRIQISVTLIGYNNLDCSWLSKNEMGGTYCTYETGDVQYRILMGRAEGRTPLGSSRRRFEDNIKMDFQEVGWGHMDWINLAQDRGRWQTLVNAVMNLWVP
jgi:hypothetical protein